MDGNQVSSKQLFKTAVADRFGYVVEAVVLAETALQACAQAEAEALAAGFVSELTTVSPTTREQISAERAKAKADHAAYLALRHEPLPVLPVAPRFIVRVGNTFENEVTAISPQAAADSVRRFANGCGYRGKIWCREVTPTGYVTRAVRS